MQYIYAIGVFVGLLTLFLILLTIAFMSGPVMKNVMHKSAPGLRIKSSRYCFVPVGMYAVSLSLPPYACLSVSPSLYVSLCLSLPMRVSFAPSLFSGSSCMYVSVFSF